MDNEQIGTTAVIRVISTTNRLKAFINSGDKEPSFDGGIYIYDNEKYLKENIKRVAVQVKGKGIKSKIQRQIKYPISIIDLENYKKNGGVMFFVVYFDKDTGETKQIYYAALLPFRIKEIIKNNQGNSKTVNVRFKKFPDDEQEITELFLYFYDNAQRQVSFVDKETPSILELKNQGILESISFSYMNLDKDDDVLKYPQIFDGKELYLYANIKGGMLPVPVEYYEEISQVQMRTSDSVDISVNGIVYYTSVIKTITAKEIIINIGTSVTIITPNTSEIKNQSDLKIKVRVKLNGNLNQRISSLEFLIAMFKYKYFEMGGYKFPAKFSNDELNKINTSEFPALLDSYKRALKALNKLNVDKPLDIEAMNLDDFRRLNLLIGAVEKGVPIKATDNNLSFVVNYNIANIRLLMSCKKVGYCSYEIEDFFNKQVDVCYHVNDEHISTSQYAPLDKDDFLSVDNLNLQNIINDYKRIVPNEMLIESGNNLMLEMLKAFDASLNEKYLVAANSMLEWLENNSNFIDKTIIMINKYQILRRKRKLSASEKRDLYMIYDNSKEPKYKIGALILLDEFDEAQKILDTLQGENKKNFMTYPIFKFYNARN